MNANTFANIRAIIIIIIALFIVLRAFYLYSQMRNPRLFILGLTMIMIALTTTVDTIGDNISSFFHLNSYWFNYFGQTISYTFFFLSLVNSSETFLRRLLRLQIAISSLLLIVLLIGPSLPSSFPGLGVTRAILSSGRAVPCFMICLYYSGAFFKKETLFSLLMGAGFLITTLAYYIIFPRYIYPHQDQIQIAGDLLRICGYFTLLMALLWG